MIEHLENPVEKERRLLSKKFSDRYEEELIAQLFSEDEKKYSEKDVESVQYETISHHHERHGEEWDVPITEEIKYFDPELSYELTKYKPIAMDKGLDFNPEWFNEAARTYESTGSYEKYPQKSKPYREYWTEQIRRCKEGYESHGYRITGDHYFFINFYRMQTVIEGAKGGSGRFESFPSFLAKQYEYFHYVEMAELLHMDVCTLKGRGVGWSELTASMAVRPYTTNRGYNVMLTANDGIKLAPLKDKCWKQLDWLNENTNGGLKHLRQKYNNNDKKRASTLTTDGVEVGWRSQIEAVISDSSDKIRGERLDRLIYEEAGSSKSLTESWIKGEALVSLGGEHFGTRIALGCVMAGTNVFKANGIPCKIENIDKSTGISGYDGYKMFPENVSYVKPTGEKECVRIKTKSGDFIECSADHPLMCMIDNYATFVRAEDIKQGDVMFNLFNGDSDEKHDGIKFVLPKWLKRNFFEGRRINNVYTTEVTDVELLGIQTVYNITADIGHNYITNGFISKNTGGQEMTLDGLSSMFWHPEAYNVLPYKNYDTQDGKPQLTSFFLPSHKFALTSKYLDNRGVTNWVEFKKYYEKQRSKLTDKDYLNECAEHCFFPEEALSKHGDNVFDPVCIAERLVQIRVQNNYIKPKKMQLLWDRTGGKEYDKVIAKESQSSHLLVIEPPLVDPESKKPYKNLYVAGIDAVDMGRKDSASNDDVSDFCVVVKKRAFGMDDPKYVAMYKFRPDDIRQAYDMTMKLLTWYNCKALLEYTKISIQTYFREKHKEYLFMSRPQFAITGGARKNSGKQLIGLPATEAVIRHGLELIANFLTDYWQSIDYEEMLDQLLNYSYENKRKFDIIAAMQCCEIADEELAGVTPAVVNSASSEWKDIVWITDERGYKRRVIAQKN